MLNTQLFGAATPQTFLDLMQALQPDPATGKPDPEKMAAFKATHPDNLAQAQYLAQHNPPVSYANSACWGIHTFKLIGKKNHQSLVRWRFLPQDVEQALSDEALKVAKNYFQAGRRRFNSLMERSINKKGGMLSLQLSTTSLSVHACEVMLAQAIENAELCGNVKRWATEQWAGQQLPGNIHRLETFIAPADLAGWLKIKLKHD